MVENTQNRVAFPIAFGEAPRHGSRAMYQLLDFSQGGAGVSVGINLTYEQQSERLEFVQSIYVDNSTNTASLTATFKGTGQTISVPAGYQAYLPVLATADNMKCDFSTSGTPKIPVWFLSCPMAPAQWPSSLSASATASTSAANSSGGTATYAALGGIGNALLTNNVIQIKGSAGNLYGVNFVNLGAAAAYVQMFDALSATMGVTVPKLSFWVPAGGAWEEKFTDEVKISFATGILVAAAASATGATSPLSGVLANIIYK